MQSLANMSDWRFLLGQSIFTAFLPSSKAEFTLEVLVKIYVAIAIPDSEEQAEMMFRLYAQSPPEFDELLKEHYVYASRI